MDFNTARLLLIHSIQIWIHSGDASEIALLDELFDIELYVGTEITLHHSFATTIIGDNIVHYDIDGDRSEHVLNEENLINYIDAVLCEISCY